MATEAAHGRHQAPGNATAPVVAGAAWQAVGRHRAVEGSAGPRPDTSEAERSGRIAADAATQRPPAPASPPIDPRRNGTGHRRLRRALILTLGVILVAVGVGVGALTLTTRHYEAKVTRIKDAFPTTSRPATAPSSVASVTVLITVVEPDATAAVGKLSDLAMLVRFTADDKHALIVFLPVDLWLTPVGQPAGTVGGMFRAGGSARLIGAVESVSRVRIDHYAELNFGGFRTITDAVGGIDVTLPTPYVGEGHTFAPGAQHLNGAEALAYLRATSPADHASDAAREQLVMNALFARLAAIGALSDLGTMSRTVDAVSSVLRVDSSLDDAGLLRLGWDHRSIGSPDFLTAPVTGRGLRGGQQVSVPDAPRLARLWADLRADDLADHLDDFR